MNLEELAQRVQVLEDVERSGISLGRFPTCSRLQSITS